MDILIKATQLLLSLSLLVVLHEFGHYLTARYFKIRVEKFYLFFNPWFSLFKKKVGDTEWGIGWLPLGGYVKISGMIDESMDKEQMEKPAEPWEFRSKPAWQRLIVNDWWSCSKPNCRGSYIHLCCLRLGRGAGSDKNIETRFKHSRFTC